MSALALLLLSSAVAFGLSRRFRIPAIPILIALGFASVHLGLNVDRGELNHLLDIGLAFLVFSAGIELNPSRFRGRIPVVLWIGVVQFLVAALLGFIVAQLLGFKLAPSLYLAVAMSTSSTLVVVRQIYRYPGSFESYGRVVLGVLLVQDLAVILLVVLLRRIPDGLSAIVPGVLGLVLMAGVAIAVQRFLPKLIARTRLPDEETLLLSVLAVLFLFSGLSHLLHLTFIAGALAAGFALSGFPVNGESRSVLDSLNTFFLAVFFGALGAQIELPGPAIVLQALAFSAIILTATPVIVATIAEWKGKLSSRNATTAGLLLAQTSEFSVILAVYGERIGQIGHEVVTVIALVAVFTMTLTPFLATDRFARVLLRRHPMRRRIKTSSDLSGHVVVLGYGSAGRWIIRPLSAAGLQIVVVDQDPAVAAQLKKDGHTVIRGDASDEKVLLQAGASQARCVLVSLPNANEVVNLIHHIDPKVPVFSRIFEKAAAEKIEAAGGIPILNSLATADRFMEWFDAEEAALSKGASTPPSTRVS